MHSHVSKWGNSLGIRIPKTIAEKVGLAAGVAIEVTIKDDHIIIQKEKYHLESLLKNINSKNIHEEITTGEISGKEVW